MDEILANPYQPTGGVSSVCWAAREITIFSLETGMKLEATNAQAFLDRLPTLRAEVTKALPQLADAQMSAAEIVVAGIDRVLIASAQVTTTPLGSEEILAILADQPVETTGDHLECP